MYHNKYYDASGTVKTVPYTAHYISLYHDTFKGGYIISSKHTHLGVYAVIRHNNQFLLIKKARGPYTGMFDLPGGKIEFGETPEQALQREISEEAGQKIQTWSLSFCDSICFEHSVTADNSIEILHHIGIIYNVTIIDNIKIKNSGDGLDSNGAFWFNFSPDNKIENLTPFAKNAILSAL